MGIILGNSEVWSKQKRMARIEKVGRLQTYYEENWPGLAWINPRMALAHRDCGHYAALRRRLREMHRSKSKFEITVFTHEDEFTKDSPTSTIKFKSRAGDSIIRHQFDITWFRDQKQMRPENYYKKNSAEAITFYKFMKEHEIAISNHRLTVHTLSKSRDQTCPLLCKCYEFPGLCQYYCCPADLTPILGDQIVDRDVFASLKCLQEIARIMENETKFRFPEPPGL